MVNHGNGQLNGHRKGKGAPPWGGCFTVQFGCMTCIIHPIKMALTGKNFVARHYTVEVWIVVLIHIIYWTYIVKMFRNKETSEYVQYIYMYIFRCSPVGIVVDVIEFITFTHVHICTSIRIYIYIYIYVDLKVVQQSTPPDPPPTPREMWTSIFQRRCAAPQQAKWSQAWGRCALKQLYYTYRIPC